MCKLSPYGEAKHYNTERLSCEKIERTCRIYTNIIRDHMGYEYHVFVSYRRYQDWPAWVHKHFIPIFRHYLGAELGEEPKIFYDVESIKSGDAWPKKLGSALAKSCVLVPLFSKTYFNSDWCQLELSSMLAREEKTGFSTDTRPGRLIIPAVIYDGESFPQIIKDIQAVDLTAYANIRLRSDSPKAEELAEVIKSWVPSVVSAIDRSPEYSDEWHQLSVENFVSQFAKALPKQRKLPRLG